MTVTQDRHHRGQLITEAQRARSPLPALMELEESPPAVPPKDSGYQSSMRGSRPPSAAGPASGSKRKRETQDDTFYNYRSGRLEAANFEHTPKRSRSHSNTRASGGYASGYASTDETPMQQRSLRRKKGSRNLSNLNLRHAASLANIDQQQTYPGRESRFQEGSLTDKPSDKPPSVFTRFTRTDSGKLSHVEELMAEYHGSMPTPFDSVEETLAYERATRDQRVAAINAQQRKEEGSGMFRFGKSLASAFHPMALWNKLWNEPKDEASQAQAEEADRKAKQKAEAEARYAQLKAAGQLGLQPVSVHKPRDSAIALDGHLSTHGHRRDISNGSTVHTQADEVYPDGSEFCESASRPLHGIASRLHLRKPSLQNLQNSLKRVKSDFSIGVAASRESSSSLSPTKADFENFALRKSHSKYDLKKQHKLSKRVSDLEWKLLKARSELNEALLEASPKPKIAGKYERFTPSGTMRKRKFVPGALPTLPSEGVLFPQQLNSQNDGTVAVPEKRSRPAIDLARAFDEDADDEEKDDINPAQEKSYPTRTKVHSNKRNHHDEAPKNDDDVDINVASKAPAKDELTALPQIKKAKKTAQQAPDDGLGADDIKPLTPNVKLSKKSAKGKKGASTKGDAAFKPDLEADDDAEWDQAAQKPKKKRKSTGKPDDSPASKRAAGNDKQKSPHGKGAKKTGPAAEDDNLSKKPSSGGLNQDVTMIDANGSEDELTKVSQRGSLTSIDEPLEPVYEEEEETVSIAHNGESSKLKIKASNAHYGRNAVRSRSNSPHKRSEPVIPGAEESVITRAAHAAQHRRPRSNSPPLGQKIQANDIITVTPGQGDVPQLPRGATGSVDSKESKKDFEWPDDVF